MLPYATLSATNVILKIWNVVLRIRVTFSSAREGYRPPIGLLTKKQNKKNNTCLALLGQILLWNGLESDLKHLLTHKFRGGANLSKIKPTNH